MEHSDEIGADTPAGGVENSNAADNNPIPCATASPQPWPNTAIERQIARVNYRKKAYRRAPEQTAPPRPNNSNTDHRKFHPAALASGLIVLLLIAAGMVFIVTDRDRLVQNAVGNFFQPVKQTVSAPNTSQTTTLPPVNENKIAAAANPNAISVPIADISLRSRPEFLEQLVQVYRVQLASNPNDAQALSALAQLQQRSLSELQTIIAEGDGETAKNSMAIAARIFPELSNNTRYMYLVTRMDYIKRQPKDEPAAKTESTVPQPATTTKTTTAVTPAPPETVVGANASQKTTAPQQTIAVAAIPVQSIPAATRSESAIPIPKPINPKESASSTKSASSTTDSATATTAKKSETAASLKPEIRAVSATPGTMVDGRFVPSNGGNTFMVEISYRNFERAFVGKAEATLVTLLGAPDDPIVLAEVPVVITADRGTTSFVMETNAVEGYAGGKFQLNFILNDEFLTSRTLRISMPRRSAVAN